MRRVAVIGLDGAAWPVLGPLLEAGAMPALASLLDRSAKGVLRSTIPPYTPPAWTSAVTGVNPGRHGIFGFVQGRGEPNLSNWGLVRAPALWNHLEASGARTGLFHLPLTFPPPAVDGWAVGAVWMPTGQSVSGFTYPRSLEDRIHELVPGYAPVSGVELFEDWRDRSLADRVASTVRQRMAVLADLLETDPVDVVWAVLEAPDRIQHAYYKYLDPAEPHASRPAAVEIRKAVTAAFAEVDRVIGMLDEFAGPEGVSIVCSDHGATGWHGYVFGNSLLARAGVLKLRPLGRALRSLGVNRLGRVARKVMPARVTYRTRRRVQSLIDPSRTLASATRLGSQGFDLRLSGRDPGGMVRPEDAARVLEEVATILREARTHSGTPFFQAVRHGSEIYSGPYSDEAPDLVVEPTEWRFEVSDALGERHIEKDLSDLPLGCHHPDGVFALRAPGVAPAKDVRASILDLLPTLLYAAGLAVPQGLDGTVRRGLFGPASPAVLTTTSPTKGGDGILVPYTPEEEAMITKYLTDLGYLG